MKKIRYFAYGSNLLLPRLERRVGGVVFAGRACLPNWVFCMNKRSADGTAKANVQRSPGDEVWGVLYELTEEQLDRLSYYEANYDRLEVHVTTEEGEELAAVTFSSNRLTDTTAVDPEYLATLIEGARAHGLPDHVVVLLESFADIADEDRVGGPAAP